MAKAFGAWRWVGATAAALLLGSTGFLLVSGYFNRDPVTVFAASGRRAGVTAIYYSGASGLRFGMGPATATALAARGIPVVGVNSATLFRTHRSPAETDAIIAATVRDGVRRAGSDRVVLIGQSFGADMLQTGLAALPPTLRTRVAAIVLVVPGADVYFRADPTGLLYHRARESDGRAAVQALTWAPLTCIYGTAETDSACPGLRLPNATVVGMPGGHFLNRDASGLTQQVLAAIVRATHR